MNPKIGTVEQSQQRAEVQDKVKGLCEIGDVMRSMTL